MGHVWNWFSTMTPNQFFGTVFLFILVALLVWLRIATEGFASNLDWVLFYVGIALVTGIAFWVYTPGSQGTLNLPQFGIHLGGGAAIGASFMLLAVLFVPKADPDVVVALPEQVRSPTVKVLKYDHEKLVTVSMIPKLPGNVFVRFHDGEEQGWFWTWDVQPGKQVETKYSVTRSGRIQFVKKKEEPADD